MARCDCENWTLQDLSDALQNQQKDNKKIVIPMFQRGQRWKTEQKHVFIDSILKSYPVGTMLFYKTIEDGQEMYILVDGLQRGTCIKNYLTNPTQFFKDEIISEQFCTNICNIFEIETSSENFQIIRGTLSSFIKKQKGLKNLQYYPVALELIESFNGNIKNIQPIIDIVTDLFDEIIDSYDRIASTVLPVIVYSGEESNLPTIFDRINSKGTPLDQYEIYAASWPTNEKFVIDNSKIVDFVIKKYEAFIDEDYQVYGYNEGELRKTKKLNAFEYLFGLGKHLVSAYNFLAFDTNKGADEVNTLSFELVNACLNDSNQIKHLYKNLATIDINKFESALYKAIDYVQKAIAPITRFKGNSRSGDGNKIFHSKYQILSMISFVFKKMFEEKEYTRYANSWDNYSQILPEKLRHHYIYDIISNYWSEGGTSKIYLVLKENKYLSDISSRLWNANLNNFYEKSMSRRETKNVSQPKSEEYVILNTIYLNTFTAMDQLSLDKFDVEHIATKEQMKSFMKSCDITSASHEGLPVSCIANLCYLPEGVNRSKGDRNFYQDKKYLQKISLNEVENKYSFTSAKDLEWMDIDYSGLDDFQVLKEYYFEFCNNRFIVLKKLFCKALGIEYIDSDNVLQESDVSVTKDDYADKTKIKFPGFSKDCAERIINSTDIKLSFAENVCLISEDKNVGYAITSSKSYPLKNGEKFWFAIRKNQMTTLSQCENQFFVYGCGNKDTIIVLPMSLIKSVWDNLNVSYFSNGQESHRHIVIKKYSDNDYRLMLSRPSTFEKSITEYLL